MCVGGKYGASQNLRWGFRGERREQCVCVCGVQLKDSGMDEGLVMMVVVLTSVEHRISWLVIAKIMLCCLHVSTCGDVCVFRN